MSKINQELDFIIKIKITADNSKCLYDAIKDIEHYFNKENNKTAKTSCGNDGCFSWSLTDNNAKISTEQLTK